MDLRAMFAIAAICALVFGLFISGAPRVSHGATSMQASPTDAHHATCHDASLGVSKDGTPGKERKARTDCPCCLAAHVSPAVLPERYAILTRLDRAASPALYLAPSTTPLRLAVSHAVNGARAPPVSISIS